MNPWIESLSRSVATHIYQEIEARQRATEPAAACADMYRGAVEELEAELATAREEMDALRRQVVETNWLAEQARHENAALRGEVSEAMNRARKHSDLCAQIRKAIGALDGVMVMNNPQGITRGRGRVIRYGLGVGSSDLIACVDGRFVGLEVKTGEGTMSKEQVAWASAIRSVGGIYREVRSVEDALAAVEEARG